MGEKKHISLKSQIKNNAIALISIIIAITSLSYNTWRNELTEDNRNQRYAAFEILLKINELQQVVFYNHYEKDLQYRGNPRLGWAYVLTIQDLAMVLPDSSVQSVTALKTTWDQYWPTLHEDQASKLAVELGIDGVRQEILSLLSALQ